jgi:hypothetical protein
MAYTLARVTDAGVVLQHYHAERLGVSDDGARRERWLAFGRQATPGVWAVWTDVERGLCWEPRPGSRLRDGISTRALPSPFIGRVGPFPKQGSPTPYDSLRREGTVTLICSADGAEIFEACSAAVVGWDGRCILCVPRDRPRVWSTAEAAIRDHLPVREAVIETSSDAVLLVNAVKGTCALADPHSRAFPRRARREIDELFAVLTGRS